MIGPDADTRPPGCAGKPGGREFRTALALILALTILLPLPAASGEPDPVPDGAVVGRIRIEPENIFDTADPKENNWLFRLANRLHVRTRPKIIYRQLLFREGEPFDRRLLEESERILRSNGYFYDARVEPGAVHDNSVDVLVRTRDVWTLRPGFSFKRKGGQNTSSLDFEETNFLGTGIAFGIARASTPDRNTENLYFTEPHLFGTWVKADIRHADNSDGGKRSYLLDRPFPALDARWAAGAYVEDYNRIETLAGTRPTASRFRKKTRTGRFYGGWSPGLRNGMAWRFTGGWAWDESRFAAVPGQAVPLPVPADRILAYPFAGFEAIEDNFEKMKNRDQIERTEDFFLGTRLRATLGFASPRFGADRGTLPFWILFGKGGRLDDRWTVVFEGSADGRAEQGKVRDATMNGAARIYARESDNWLFFASVSASRMIGPDDDHVLTLGGENGLRGYPTSYQAGERKILATVEQRYYTSWYPFRLFRIGGAVFLDAGRAWGGKTSGLAATGLLADGGFGLRIGNARSALGNVIHIDVAFPFNGDPKIDRVQLLVETKRSF